MNLPKLHPWQVSPVLATLLVFPLVWMQLAKEWWAAEQDLTHGFPALLAYLYVLVFRPIPTHQNSTLTRALILLALAGLLLFYSLAELVNIDVFTYAALLAALPCFIALFFGWRASLSLWHLHLFFILPLPIWDGFLETLVQLASVVCSNFMKLFDLPMLIEGNSITLPTGRILIAEGCSGIRYFLVSIILGYLLSNLNGYTGWRLILTVTCGACLGLLANWIRIILLIFIGYYSEMQSSLMADHETFGWIIFAVFCLPALYFAPQHKPTAVTGHFYSRPAIQQGLAWLAIGAATTLTVLWLSSPPKTIPINYNDLQVHWQPAADQLPAGIQAPTVPYRTFVHSNTNTTLTLVTHQRGHANDKLVPFFPQSRVGDVWFLESTGTLKSVFGRQSESTTTVPTELDTEQFKSLINNSRILSIQIFKVGDVITSSYTHAKLLQIPALLKRDNVFTYYLLQSRCKTATCEGAKKSIQTALSHLKP
jgi:exosortase